eukprot:7276380-Pyramimonas_sp.AAC.1
MTSKTRKGEGRGGGVMMMIAWLAQRKRIQIVHSRPRPRPIATRALRTDREKGRVTHATKSGGPVACNHRREAGDMANARLPISVQNRQRRQTQDKLTLERESE